MRDVSLLPLDDPHEAQRGASDPGASVWVAASAGTGKTKVLTDRVLRLMLAGSEPGRILCLTYTKAAAAEMANRIADRLGDWATADAARLEAHLLALLGRRPTDDQRRMARQLFARVLDAPGGLNIQTIHAFCQSLLARFPLEAGVAPHSTVMEERDAEDLLAAARQNVIEAAGDISGRLGDAFAVVTRHIKEGRFAGLMKEIAQSPAGLLGIIEAHGSAEAAVAAMRGMLGLAPQATPESVLTDACAQETYDRDGLRRAAAALARGSEAECRRAAIIDAWLEADPATRAETFERYTCVFLTRKTQVREDRALVSRRIECAWPGTLEILRTEAERLACVLPRQRAAVTAEASEALLMLGEALVRRYRDLKHRWARLDYNDLIEMAARLLRDDGSASWVLYKLDGGIDHVLIDEAQDTAPEQWEVIKKLTEEFFAGEGSRGIRRTIFAVGDVKQSIFSFQGADPAAFLASRNWYGGRVRGAGHDWRPIPLQTSFRSTRAVLTAVDATFEDPEMVRSIALEPEQIVHQAYRLRDGGSVEVWQPVAPRSPDKPDPWTPPIERVATDSPQIRLARLIAARIQEMLGKRELLQSKGRPIAAGDIMVLVRRRTVFMQALVRALKERQLPIAGVDRMLLTEQLAVMDLIALGKFALLPEDDLTLATVLKGPLVGLDEDALFTLAYGHKGTLWRALRDRALSDDRCAKAHRQLSEILALADQVAPFEFFMRVLGPQPNDDPTESGRRKLLSRLGHEADDTITEFLEIALAYERIHPPSLQGFLYWLERSDVEIKRDPEQGQHNAVRVMTVHGAKGLQAPIVFLPDTCQMPDIKESVLWPSDDDGRTTLLWPPSARFFEEVAENERKQLAAKQLEEYRRLLYVAMTRASDRLIVCGWLTRNQKNGPAENCWYRAIETAVRPIATEIEDAFLSRVSGPTGLIDSPRVLHLACPQERTPEPAPAADEEATEALPPWAMRPAPAVPSPVRPLRPSHEEQPTVLPPVTDKARFQRGRLIHRLLQELPEIAPTARADAARRWLARPTHRLSAETQAEVAAEVLAVIGDSRFAPLFGPGSRAEVPLSGQVYGQLITGQIDRITVSDDEVTILDYKSDRPAPACADRVPPAYLRQMAAYRALLRQIYPGRAVRCLLLWTEEPRPMPLDDAILDRWMP
jgi:ATP-dependent helicase/nuclease subunit A